MTQEAGSPLTERRTWHDDNLLLSAAPCPEGLCGVIAVDSTVPSICPEHACDAIAAAAFDLVAQIENRQAREAAQQASAIAELLARMAGETSIQQAADRLVKSLQEHLGASAAMLGLPRNGAHLEIVATAGGRGTDYDGVEAVMLESRLRQTTGVCPTDAVEQRHGLLCHQQFLRDHADVGHVVTCPLAATGAASTHEESSMGGVIVLLFGVDQNPQATAATRFLDAANGPLAAVIQMLTLGSETIPARITRRIRALASQSLTRTTLTIAAAMTAILLLPVDYRVDCNSEVQPAIRRFIAAPFDAPLEQCLVEPGDVVEKGQTLAILDGRELRWELAGVEADLGKAQNEHDASLSEYEYGDAAIAEHEILRLHNRRALLTDRADRLQIRSPVAGIVVEGDLRDSAGVPLKSGESLFEVAPLDRMVIDIAIPEDDVRFVSKGMAVNVQLNAKPSRVFRGTIRAIHPRAEIVDGENVFLAETVISQPESWLRPGMRGTASISTGQRTLGWNLLHAPFAHLRGWLGW